MQNCRASFGHLWQQQDLSDVTLILKTQDAVLQQLHAHVVILSISPYFKAQVQRWAISSGSEKPTIALILSDAEQTSAAMTVLAAMYGVDPAPDESLTDQQLLQILLVADMLQIEHITALALQQFMQYAEKGLSSDCRDQLLRLPNLPACLLDQFPVLTGKVPLRDVIQLWVNAAAPSSPCSLEILLTAPHSSYMQKRLSDPDISLEETVAFAASKQELLSVPLPIMQLLLSSDTLLASEDTVLYVAQSYVAAQPTEQQQQTAQQLLAPLVRCPHLSQFWLTAMLVSPRADKMLLGSYIPQIRQLAPVLQAYPAESAARSMRQVIPDAPSSWLQQPRSGSSVQQTDTVALRWEVPWLDVVEVCDQAARKNRSVFIASKDTTEPLGGLMWRLELHAVRVPRWKQGLEEQDDKTGTLGLFAVPVNCPPGMFFTYKASITAGRLSRCLPEPADAFGNNGAGWSDFFGVGPVPLPWYRCLSAASAAWDRMPRRQRKGLPSAGTNLRVQLVIERA